MSAEISREHELEALAHIYAEAMLRGQATGFGHGLRVGYAVGRHAQAMDDSELVEAVGRWVLDQQILEREVTAVMRATVADMRALNYRRKN